MRRHRVWIVAIFVGTLVFAQAAAAAHACAWLTTPTAPPSQVMDTDSQVMPAGCEEMAHQSDSTVNVCVTHCVGSDQSSGSADVPTAAVAPQPALSIRASAVCVPAYSTLSLVVSPAAAPPPHLRFARFLI